MVTNKTKVDASSCTCNPRVPTPFWPARVRALRPMAALPVSPHSVLKIFKPNMFFFLPPNQLQIALEL